MPHLWSHRVPLALHEQESSKVEPRTCGPCCSQVALSQRYAGCCLHLRYLRLEVQSLQPHVVLAGLLQGLLRIACQVRHMNEEQDWSGYLE